LNVRFREVRLTALGRFLPLAIPDTCRSRFPKPATDQPIKLRDAGTCSSAHLGLRVGPLRGVLGGAMATPMPTASGAPRAVSDETRHPPPLFGDVRQPVGRNCSKQMISLGATSAHTHYGDFMLGMGSAIEPNHGDPKRIRWISSAFES
jgi:hypothetical protein